MDRLYAEFDTEMKIRNGNIVDYFSHLDVISTDVPGMFGYNGSRFHNVFIEKGVVRDYGSFFCRFGGTSAAAALVGGSISLGETAGEFPEDTYTGISAKRWLISKSKPVPSGDIMPIWTDDEFEPPPIPSIHSNGGNGKPKI